MFALVVLPMGPVGNVTFDNTVGNVAVLLGNDTIVDDTFVLFNKLLTVELINDGTVVLETLIIVLEFEEFVRGRTLTVVFNTEEVVVVILIVVDEFNAVLLIVEVTVEFNKFGAVIF
jgi:hypothetical protein